eukprot:Plantae.Rhodophyta-Hildenbrandia_rubra.ctg6616.p1 GENE.Plantae.Rhodophyta-Hildenbrandia_rubra.ctg6616~~Plantae.Rhodophyta-Hildenbrandia_rubra.ctg6616.p1  ORF type:complete len:820 (+),score=131.66 Plantae.Rhodophyta-Hildenbrandia_rubra.ctg6616:837-3296(+)
MASHPTPSLTIENQDTPVSRSEGAPTYAQAYESFEGRAFSGTIAKRDEIGYHVQVQIGDRELVGYLVNHVAPGKQKAAPIKTENDESGIADLGSRRVSEVVKRDLDRSRQRAGDGQVERESFPARIRRELLSVEPIDRLKVRKRSVIIVGAGLAGTAAARALSGRGYSVKLLEARKRIGGRVFTDWSLGSPVDMGASHIYGAYGNPLHELLRELKLRSYVQTDEQGQLQGGGNTVLKVTRERVNKVWEEMLLKAHSYAENARRNWRKAENLGTVLERIREEIAPSMTSGELRIINWHLSKLELRCGSRIENLSARYWDYDEFYSHLGDLAMVRDGFSTLTCGLASEVDVICDSPVDRIERDVEIQTLGLLSKPFAFSPRRIPAREPDGTQTLGKASHLQMSECTTKGLGVRVRTKSGKIYLAERCIVTVPLGVLQQSQICFVPRLPSWKENAINSIGFGTTNKIALRFENPFWLPLSVDENQPNRIARNERVEKLSRISQKGLSLQDAEESPDYIGRIDGERGEFRIFLSLYRCTGAPILIILTSGQAAENIEQQSDAQVIESAMSALRTMFVHPPARLVAYSISRWKSDEYSRGSVSYLKTKTRPGDFDRMSRPVGDTLCFAGEATTRRHFGSAHGAYISGIREAGRVLESGGFDDKTLALYKAQLDKAADPTGFFEESCTMAPKTGRMNATAIPLNVGNGDRRAQRNGRSDDVTDPDRDRAGENPFKVRGGVRKSRNGIVKEIQNQTQKRQYRRRKQEKQEQAAEQASTVKELNEDFKKAPFPARSNCQNLANMIGMDVKSVETWFVRRRCDKNVLD